MGFNSSALPYFGLFGPDGELQRFCYKASCFVPVIVLWGPFGSALVVKGQRLAHTKGSLYVFVTLVVRGNILYRYSG